MKVLFFTLILILGTTTVFAQQEFPNIKNLSDVKIEMTLESAGNSNYCRKSYNITIYGNGTVDYEGFECVKLKGKHKFLISKNKVQKLVENFKNAGFFSLEHEYNGKKLPDGSILKVSHSDRTTMFFAVGEESKKIENYYGSPVNLIYLQRQVQKIVTDLTTK